MKYFKVKPEYDNFRLIYNGKHNGILVGNELYTEKELYKKKILFCYGVDFKMFTMIEIPKNKVYFFFGARFAD